jgi:hypothetical protein
MDHGTAKNKNLTFHREINRSVLTISRPVWLASTMPNLGKTGGELHVMQSCCSALLFPNVLDGSSDG